jgi:phosphatidylinositol alpha-mannosyltransferase
MIDKPLKIGIVCPYGWDAPGGVQAHIADLRSYLVNKGHSVSVLAPTNDEDALPEWVVNAGKPISIPYNGAVARVLFGPTAFNRVKQWISENEFDLLHLHEPAGPMVGTFHVAAKKQKASFAIVPILEPVIEKLSARIAVSEAARETLRAHLETDAVVIPNGIYAKKMSGKIRAEWHEDTLGFMGRFNEPRKGLKILIDALPIISRFMPNIRVLVAGPGDAEEFLSQIDPQLRNRVQFLGKLTDEEKADFMSSVSVFVAPNTGGESFGIILAEALAGGATVVASDIPAFQALLKDGQFGKLFKSEDSTDLAKVLIDLLRDETSRKTLSILGKNYSQSFDWDVVAENIFEVYEMAIVGGGKVGLVADNRPWNKIWNRD